MTKRTDQDGPSDTEWLLAELDRIEGCPATKARILALLRSMAGRRLWLSKAALVRPEQIRTARAMLDAGYTATQARAELAARVRVSRRTAERVMVCALTERAMQAQMRLSLAPDEARSTEDAPA